jgi:hypothetical protein
MEVFLTNERLHSVRNSVSLLLVVKFLLIFSKLLTLHHAKNSLH